MMFDANALEEAGRVVVRAITYSALIPIIALVRPFPIFLKAKREAKFALGSVLMLNIIWNVFRTKVMAPHEPSVETYVAWGIAWFVLIVGFTGVISVLWPYATSSEDRSRGEKRFKQCASVLAVVLIPSITYWAFL